MNIVRYNEKASARNKYKFSALSFWEQKILRHIVRGKDLNIFSGLRFCTSISYFVTREKENCSNILSVLGI